MSDDNQESEQGQEAREEQEEHVERNRPRSSTLEAQTHDQDVERSGHNATDMSDERRRAPDQSETYLPQFDQEGPANTESIEFTTETHLEQKPDADVPQFAVENADELSERAIEEDAAIDAVKEVATVPAFAIENLAEVPSVQLASTIATKANDEQNDSVPQIETDDNVEWGVRELDAEVPEIDQEKAVSVPRFHINDFETIKPYSRLLQGIPESISEMAEEEVEAMVEAAELEVEKTGVGPGTATSERLGPSSSTGGLEEEWPDPLELVFGTGGGEISSDEPIVICINDEENEDFVAILETLVQRLYREKVGGQPDPKRFGDAEELTDETRWVEAEHKIFTAKFDDEEWKVLKEDLQKDWDRIWNNRILNELYGQDFGALIFNQVYFADTEDHHPKIIQLNPPSLSPFAKENLIRLFWGLQDDSGPIDQQTFGQRFNFYGERIVENQWNKIETAENGIFLDATVPDENAGKHHRRMKVLVIKRLVDRLRNQGYDLETPTQIKTKIESEKEYKRGDDTLASVDILCKAVDDSPRGVFEVETLYAEDRASGKPRDKLRDTFTKYEEIDSVGEINIILDNL